MSTTTASGGGRLVRRHAHDAARAFHCVYLECGSLAPAFLSFGAGYSSVPTREPRWNGFLIATVLCPLPLPTFSISNFYFRILRYPPLNRSLIFLLTSRLLLC